MMGGQSGQLPGFGRIVIQRRRAALLLASGCNFSCQTQFHETESLVHFFDETS